MASEWAAQVIGINYYPEYTTLKPLTAAAEDAEKIAEQLEQYGYRPFRAQCLPRSLNQKGESKIDRQGAVRVQELREAIANLFNPPPPNPTPETALFFFSGHGWCKTVAGKEEVFLATSDALPEEEVYGIPLSWLGEQLQRSQAKRVVVWLEVFYGRSALTQQLIKQVRDKHRLIAVLGASGSGKSSMLRAGWVTLPAEARTRDSRKRSLDLYYSVYA
ncbi:caspase family protein [Nostoc sp. CHAB 5784]|nr:caspase family protein [Nostoc mirabile CHAB5784]